MFASFVCEEVNRTHDNNYEATLYFFVQLWSSCYFVSSIVFPPFDFDQLQLPLKCACKYLKLLLVLGNPHCNTNLLLMILRPLCHIKHRLPSAEKCLLLLFLTLNSASVKAQPVITSFSPSSGPAGTVVTITGNNFSSNPSENIVHFGLVRGQVLNASATSIQAVVPVNASGHLLTVTTNAKTTSSTRPFFITYADNGKPISKEAYTKEIKIPLSRRRIEPPSGSNYIDYSMAVADFDADGKIDIICLGSDGDSLMAFRNSTANNNFQFDSSIITTGFKFHSLMLSADFNADGYADILCHRNEDSSLYILPNKSTNGNLSFGQPLKITKYIFGYSNQFTVEDIDQDGLIDLTFFERDLATVFFYKNNSTAGSISFAAKTNIFEYKVPGYTIASYGSGVVASDINNDGKKDLILFLAPYELPPLGDYHGETVILQNKGTTGSVLFEKAFSMITKYPQTPSEVFTSDINGDGLNDLLETIDLDYFRLGIFLNNGSQQAINFNSQFTEYYGYSNHIRTRPAPIPYDLNGDAKPDIVFTTQYHDYDSLDCYIHLYENKSVNNNLVLGTEVEIIKNAVRYLSVADLNNNSKPELFYIRYHTGNKTDTLIIMEQQTSIVTSVSEQPDNDFYFSFYPNPAAKRITVNLPASTHPSVVSITNFQGQQISTFRFKPGVAVAKILELDYLLPGMYLVTWSDGKRRKTKTLLVH